MNKLEVKNDSYTIATGVREYSSIAKYGEGFIIAYETSTFQISVVIVDKYYQIKGSAHTLNEINDEYFPTIS